MGIPRPDRRHKVAAVRALAEVPLLHALVVNIVALLHLDSRIDDRYQVDAPVLHFRHEGGEIGKLLSIDGEVLVVVHVVNVQIQHIQGQAVLPVAVHYAAEVRTGLVPPPALAEAEGEFRGDVAGPDEPAELPDDVIGALPRYNVQVQIRPLAGNGQRIHAGIAHVEHHPRRVVEEEAHALPARHNQEVVGGVHGLDRLRVHPVVGAAADVPEAPLVQAPVGLSQAVDDILLLQPAGKPEAVLCGNLADGEASRGGGGFPRHRLRGKGRAVDVLGNHTVSPSSFCQLRRTRRVTISKSRTGRVTVWPDTCSSGISTGRSSRSHTVTLSKGTPRVMSARTRRSYAS